MSLVTDIITELGYCNAILYKCICIYINCFINIYAYIKWLHTHIRISKYNFIAAKKSLDIPEWM